MPRVQNSWERAFSTQLLPELIKVVNGTGLYSFYGIASCIKALLKYELNTPVQYLMKNLQSVHRQFSYYYKAYPELQNLEFIYKQSNLRASNITLSYQCVLGYVHRYFVNTH